MRAGELTPRRVLIGTACVLALAVCCLLAWWQWQRYTSVGGSFLNLGYVLQWPLFGLFPAFMFWRLRRLRQHEQQEQRQAEQGYTHLGTRRGEPHALSNRSGESSAASPGQSRRSGSRARTTPGPGDAEDPEDAELAAYNRYLAELERNSAK